MTAALVNHGIGNGFLPVYRTQRRLGSFARALQDEKEALLKSAAGRVVDFILQCTRMDTESYGPPYLDFIRHALQWNEVDRRAFFPSRLGETSSPLREPEHREHLRGLGAAMFHSIFDLYRDPEVPADAHSYTVPRAAKIPL